MKNNEKRKAIGNGNEQGGGNGSRRIRLEFTDSAAHTVSIAGTFNNWRPDATPMVSLGNGHWIKELALPVGTYEYRFVADGKWTSDPGAKASAPNPYGGVNSVLKIS